MTLISNEENETLNGRGFCLKIISEHDYTNYGWTA